MRAAGELGISDLESRLIEQILARSQLVKAPEVSAKLRFVELDSIGVSAYAERLANTYCNDRDAKPRVLKAVQRCAKEKGGFLELWEAELRKLRRAERR